MEHVVNNNTNTNNNTTTNNNNNNNNNKRANTLGPLNLIHQRFSNFFQVGTTFISQNVLRTTLPLGLSNSLGLP